MQTYDTSDLKDFKVHIYDKQYAAQVVFLSDSAEISPAYDIALLKVYIPSLSIETCKKLDNPSECNSLFIIKAKTKAVVPNDMNGTFEYWMGSDEKVYYVLLDGIDSGDSGSALFCEDKIAGMIIRINEDYGIVININHIQRVIAKVKL